MKLHLSKQLFTALLAAFTLAAPAALTIGSTAWGEEETTGETAESTIAYSGTVYSYTGVNSDTELAFSILSYETSDGTATISGKSGSWTNIQNAIGKDEPDKTFNTLRFYGTSPAVKALTYTFNPIAVAGFIVESGASGYSITSSGTSERHINIGNTSETKAYTTIEENFSLNNTSDIDSSINLRGEQEWQIANGKTFTLTSGSSGIINQAEGNLTISGQGTAVMGSAFTNNGTLTVNSGATLTLSSTLTNNGSLLGSGTLAVVDLYNFAGKGSVSGYSIEGNSSANGYATYSTVTLITGEGTVADTLKVSMGGSNDYQASAKSYANVLDTDYFWVNSGTVTTGGDSSTTGTGTAKGFIVNGGTLKITEGNVVVHDYKTDSSTSKIEIVNADSEVYFDYLFGTGTTTMDVDGAGRVSAGFASDSGHGQWLDMGSDFTGTLSIREGWMQLQQFKMGTGAKLELISGQHWSAGDSTIAYDIHLAGNSKGSAYVFRNSGTDTITGKVTGNFLNVGTTVSNGGTLVLQNAGNVIDYVTVGSSSTKMGLTIAENMSVGQIISEHAESNITINEGKCLTITGVSAANDYESTITKLTAGGTGSTLKLSGEKVTLNTLGSVSGTVTLIGSGVYKLAAGTTALTSGVSLGNEWTGVVLVSNYGTNQTISLADITDAKTDGVYNLGNKVGLSNVVAWLGGSTIYNNLQLVKPQEGAAALTLNNGSSNTTGIFAGAISGDGDIRFTWSSGNTNSAPIGHKFTGDTSAWDGWFISGSENSNKRVAVYFTSDGSVFSAEGNGGVKDAHETAADSKLEVVIGDSSTNATNIAFNGSIQNARQLDVYGNVTFNRQVQAATANFNGAANVTLGGGTAEAPITHSIGTLSAASSTVSMAENATLTLGDGTNASTHSIGTVVASSAGNTIHLNDKATLNRLSNVTGTVTLSGSGVYDLGSNTSANVSGLTAATWTGTVKITGANFESDKGIPLQNLGNSESSIELSGVTAFQPNALTNKTCKSDIILNNGQQGFGLKITDGWAANYNDGAAITFTGDISGNGKLEFVQRNANTLNQKYVFTGDISKWQGAIEHDEGGANLGVYLVFDGNASEVNTAITGGVGGLNVEAKTDVAFNQDLTSLSSFVVNNGRTATVNATLSAGTVNLGSTATITGKDSGTVSMAQVKMNATGISSADTTGATKGSISNANVALAQLAEDATFTIQDMTLTNTTISAATPTTQVKLQNVAATNLELAQGKFTMNAAPTVGAGGTTANFGTNTDSSFMISKLMAGSASLTLNLDVMGAYESTGAVDNVTLTITLAGITGDVSSYDVDAWKALVGFEESSWLGQALTGAQYSVDDVATAAEGGVPSVSYGYAATGGEGSNVGTLTITIAGLNVPEPASATLGLAALMMLCARRRRKA